MGSPKPSEWAADGPGSGAVVSNPDEDETLNSNPTQTSPPIAPLWRHEQDRLSSIKAPPPFPAKRTPSQVQSPHSGPESGNERTGLASSAMICVSGAPQADQRPRRKRRCLDWASKPLSRSGVIWSRRRLRRLRRLRQANVLGPVPALAKWGQRTGSRLSSWPTTSARQSK